MIGEQMAEYLSHAPCHHTLNAGEKAAQRIRAYITGIHSVQSTVATLR